MHKQIVAMIPHVQVRHNALVFYNIPSINLSIGNKITSAKTYTGEVKSGSKKRIHTAIDLMIQMYPKRKIVHPEKKKAIWHQLAFATLTMSDKDRLIKVDEGNKLLLEPFLLYGRRKLGVHTYLWKGEYQSNGQLHYHILTPTYIPWMRLRSVWNGVVENSGLMDSFKKQYGHNNPNSTDIHDLNKVNDVQGYVMKYMSKDVKQENSKGKVWGCSNDIRGKKLFSFIECSDNVFDIDINKVKKLENALYYPTKEPLSHIASKYKELHSKYLTDIKLNKAT